jgi:AraC-like DNA-binding protein
MIKRLASGRKMQRATKIRTKATTLRPRKAPDTTVLARWTAILIGVPELAERADPILLELGLSRDSFRVPGRIAYEHTTELWHRLTDAFDSDFGMRLASARFTPGTAGVVGHLAAASSTLGDALERVVAYQRLIKDAHCLRLETRRECTSLVDIPPLGSPPWPRHLAESLIAAYLVLARRYTGVALRAYSVRFQHRAPPDTSAHRRHFGCEVQFAQPVNEISFGEKDLHLPMRGADDELRQLLERVAEEESDRLPRSGAMVERVRAAVAEALPGGPPPLDRIAKRLSIGERTLQRRLAAADLTYQAVLDSVRHEMAVRLLGREDLSVSEVAFLVGFTEPSGFRRAYRRWTGRAPREDLVKR